MLFEIINNFIENLLISYFISTYLKIDAKSKYSFIFICVPINTIISTVLSSLDIIGFLQTLIIQLIIWLFLYIFDKNFSYQDIVISMFCNILLFISVYFSILIFSIFFKISPIEIFTTDNIFYINLFLSRVIFIILLLITSKKRPLILTNIKNRKSNNLLVFEFLIVLIMAYYFTSNIISINTYNSSNIIFLCFLMLVISFCLIFNEIIKSNAIIYKNKLKEQQEEYRKNNLETIRKMKYEIDNISHRMNYILQSIEFDLNENNYSSAINKINSYKKTINKFSNVIHTKNELFDFMLNYEVHNPSIETNNNLKLYINISENQFYNNMIFINKITDSLQYLLNSFNELELFISELEDIVEIKYIIHINKGTNININNIPISNFNMEKLDNLIIISYTENINDK